MNAKYDPDQGVGRMLFLSMIGLAVVVGCLMAYGYYYDGKTPSSGTLFHTASPSFSSRYSY
ncbi:hypothetical protein 4R [Ranavirus ambystoma1]|uniref:Transmembrane protein n=1 Tax=Ranavirus ambystoma1 TaxID=265294 RepID=A0A0U2RWA8_9VIRU|nr:hypothetical protein 4R [Ambystoma tigrinum virus]ALN36595.1 hypothetical protein 4R [Ambystoma tigrinum virus]ALN37005.1 hypothetical protein 4R [Ambystoma tigrinum virus]ALN37305.1 hypothetical protein 4R [Ambystoma tigrinum virus]ALN37407.1 hypothetical protein 4R [Ambystoma tigrinum virus]